MDIPKSDTSRATTAVKVLEPLRCSPRVVSGRFSVVFNEDGRFRREAVRRACLGEMVI